MKIEMSIYEFEAIRAARQLLEKQLDEYATKAQEHAHITDGVGLTIYKAYNELAESSLAHLTILDAMLTKYTEHVKG